MMNIGQGNSYHIPLPVVPFIPLPNTSSAFYCHPTLPLPAPVHKYEVQQIDHQKSKVNNHIANTVQTNVKREEHNHVIQRCGKRKGHDCDVCGKNYRQKAILKTHMKVHEDEKEHYCSECGRGFTYKTNMDVHMRIHSGDKPYKCPHCQKSFSQANSLKYHLSIHTGYRPYTCRLCQKKFVTKGNLKDHMVSHSDEKPYRCNLCSNSFARKVSLLQHNRTHSNYKPYKCQYCPNAYAAQSSLLYHNKKHCGPDSRDYNKLHTSTTSSSGAEEDMDFDFLLENELLEKEQPRESPLVCLICSKSFSYQFMYLRHSQACFGPTSDKFTCGDCNLSFNDHTALEHHKHQHRLDSVAAEQLHQDNLAHARQSISSDNNDGHKCVVCHEKFSSKSSLLEHVQQHIIK